MQDLTAILIYGNGRHVRPWGIWGGSPPPHHLPLDQLQTPSPPPRLQLPRGGGVSASNYFLGFSGPDSTPGSSQSLPGSLRIDSSPHFHAWL